MTAARLPARARRLVAGLLLVCTLTGAGSLEAQAQTPALEDLVDAAGRIGDQGEDPRITEARRAAEEARRLQEQAATELSSAEQRRLEASVELDEAVAAYETVNAHHQRLVHEAGREQHKVDEAERVTAQLEATVSQRIAAVYKRPETRLELTSALLDARDAATALHRVELVGQLSARGVEQIHAAENQQVRTTDMVRQHAVVTAGVSTSAAEFRRAADDLTLALAAARHRLEQAEQDLAAARESAAEQAAAVESVQQTVADERADAARRAALSAQAALTPFAAPLPPVDGKVCPLGAPNGFSDSWGAPRSGGRQHQGVDMFAAYGTPIYAVADGVVRATDNRLGGLSIHLTDGEGNRYYYAHLSERYVSTGQRVTAGELIGANGNSGNARTTPPHLHWQYHPGGGAPVNPYPLAHALCR